MIAAKPDVGPAIASEIVAPNATNLVLLFPLNPIPVSTQRLVCHWHRDSGGRLVCDGTGCLDGFRGGIS